MLERKAKFFAEGYDELLSEAREIFPTTKELALPGIIRKYMENKSVPLDAAFFMDVALPLFVLSMAVTTCKWTRLFLSVGLHLLGYYISAVLMAASVVVSMAFSLFRRPEPARGAVVIENGRMAITGMTAIAVVMTCLFSYWQPSPVAIFTAAGTLGFLAIISAIPSIQYHGATDIAKMFMTVVLAAASLYAASAITLDSDQIYLLVKTGTFTYHIPPPERGMAVKMDQVDALSKYYSKFPEVIRNRYAPSVLDGLDYPAPTGPGTTHSREYGQYVIIFLHAIVFSLGMFTIFTETGETDRVVGDIKLLLLDKISIKDLYGSTTLAKISILMTRIDWLAILAGNLIHTQLMLDFPSALIEVVLCIAVLPPTYIWWQHTYGTMAGLKGTNSKRIGEGTTVVAAPVVRTTTSYYISGMTTILGITVVLVNTYYYVVGANPYYIALNISSFTATMVLMQDQKSIHGYWILATIAFALNSPTVLVVGSLFKYLNETTLWSRTT
nr:MAG: hypothetical protein [Guangdong Jingmen-like virus]